MLKNKSLPEQSDIERGMKQQADLTGRLRDFKDWVYDKVKGWEKTAGTAKVVFFFEHHSPRDFQMFKEWVDKNKPDVIVLEEQKDVEFGDMLEGRISIEKLMEIHKSRFPEYSRPRYELLREYYQMNKKINREVKIEQVDPLPKNTLALFLREIGGEIVSTDIRIGNFDSAVKGILQTHKLDAIVLNESDARRASAIEKKIREGEWRGTVLIEAGSAHTRVKNLLRKRLRHRDSVEVSSFYTTKNIAEKEFGGGTVEVYHQGEELTRRNIYKKDLGGEMLLAARFLVASSMYIFESKQDEAEVINYRAMKMANQLSYEECKEIYKKIEDMNQLETFDFVKEYLKKREGKTAD